MFLLPGRGLLAGAQADDHIADPLIDDADQGMSTKTIRDLFAKLRHELVPMVRAIAEQPPTDDRCLHSVFDEDDQLDFGLMVKIPGK